MRIWSREEECRKEDNDRSEGTNEKEVKMTKKKEGK
jgi:hypothetical protein